MGARILLTAVLLLAACDKPEIAPNATGGEAAARGKTAAERLGCGACHAMSGIWPQGNDRSFARKVRTARHDRGPLPQPP
ncbi:hypothetical protein [Novosphingobium pentaromativorans]|uniref:Cytochrome c domain-containing protein n=1 Tax=Novosphingobium pentaromativorans US6-1 TaxID=1088721 RepID=G6EJE8_9SPHN|nr:hypothetical protein [Novosphingobium pentaromativorans]EHJ58561.1 hypothetical protein NSU_4469 [Novosphingobium pentaromativorans US6-1]